MFPLQIYVHAANHAGYYPGAAPISLKLLFSPADGRVLGCQATGTVEGVEKRVDVIATIMQAGGCSEQTCFIIGVCLCTVEGVEKRVDVIATIKQAGGCSEQTCFIIGVCLCTVEGVEKQVHVIATIMQASCIGKG